MFDILNVSRPENVQNNLAGRRSGVIPKQHNLMWKTTEGFQTIKLYSVK